MEDMVLRIVQHMPRNVFGELLERIGSCLFVAELRRKRVGILLNSREDENGDRCRGEIPSPWLLDAIQEVARAAMTDPQTQETDPQTQESVLSPSYIAAMFQLVKEPWRAPTELELDELAKYPPKSAFKMLKSDPFHNLTLRGPWVKTRREYRFSAAAAAIDFLSSIPATTRQDLRNIALHENRLAVGNPECHGRGLVQFCEENPKLHIQRRVSLWRACFIRADCNHFTWPRHDRVGCAACFSPTGLYANHATQPVARWICEASLLPE